MFGQNRFSLSGTTADQDHLCGGLFTPGGDHLIDPVQFDVTSDQPFRRRPRPRSTRRLVPHRTEDHKNIGGDRSVIRVTRQQGSAKPSQVLRNGGGQRGWILVLFGPKDLCGRTGKGQSTRQCFIEHDANRVPVRCGCHFAVELFRGHVRWCSGNHYLFTRIRKLAEVHNKTEIEQLNSTILRDHDIGWFQVAVYDFVTVQCLYAADELG